MPSQLPSASLKKEFIFPEPRCLSIGNGLTLMVLEDHRRPFVAVDLMQDTGSIRHGFHFAGLAAVTSRLLTQGTKNYSAQQLAQAIDLIGGSLSTHATKDAAYVSLHALKPAVDYAISLMAEAVLYPTFASQEVERLLLNQSSGLQIQYREPEFLAFATAERYLFGVHPYAMPMDGSLSSLAGIHSAVLENFYFHHSRSGNAFLILSGDISWREAVTLAQEYFGAWMTNRLVADPLPPISASPVPMVLLVDVPHAVQTQIVIGQRIIPRNHPDYLPLLLANQIFGASFNSRLNLRLRAKEGLTYGARSLLQVERLDGLFLISTFTQTDTTQQAVQIIMDLLDEFLQGPITSAELEEARAYLTGSFPIHNETVGQIADRLMISSLFSLPDNYWKQYRMQLDEIDIHRVINAVRRHIQPGRCVIVAAGETGKFQDSLGPFGEVLQIPSSELDPAREDLFPSPSPKRASLV